MKNVPDRWEAYKNMGRQIPGTRFICFKVPLKEEIVRNAVRNGAEWFCPRTLMDHCQNLGLIVDLTYTDRYYNPSVFTTQGIRHAKLKTQGKVIPKAKDVKRFFKIIDSFLEENKENEKLIGVHCTHGLNRSGYLVCRYMIQHLGIPPDQAIADFNSARGHEQERQNYLDHLRQMGWEREPAAADEEEEEEAAVEKTTPTTNRRGKRNFDTFRDEDGGDDSWPSGPVRKWPRTPHQQQRSYYDQQYSGQYSSSPYSWTKNSSSKSPVHRTKTSPYGGQRYYDSHYRGRVAPQYDPNFYQQQGSGMGPHRQSPRWSSRNVHWDSSSGGRPRQYRGPRQYQTPPQRERERLDQTPNNSPLTPHTPRMEGPRRNPFSPGPSGNVFSPVTTTRRRHMNYKM